MNTNNEMPSLNFERAALVYQKHLAQVFTVECFNLAPFGREAKLLILGDYSTCESFARGLAAAGVKVATYTCNQEGDISEAKWSSDLGQHKHFAVFSGVDPVPLHEKV